MQSSVTITGRADASRWGAFLALIGPSLKAHAILFAILAAYVACTFLIAALFPIRQPDFASMAKSFLGFMIPVQLIALVTLRFANLAIHVRPKHPTIALYRDLRDFLLDPQRAANGLVMTVILFVFIRHFSLVKDNIPRIMPFSWDEAFMRLDLWVHFGRHPWEWLQPVLGHAPVTFALNVAYNLWFIVMWVLWVAFAFARMPSELRTRFFIAFMLVWSVGGGLAAILMSSAGPAFYGHLGLPDNPYLPLMSYLYGVDESLPLWALKTQELLWAGYQGQQDAITGISAMPSMHSASALLFALVGWQLGRRLGIALSVYAFFILLGSVHLGWHYAIDAYFAYALTLAIWWVSGRLAAWSERTPWSVAYRRLMSASEGRRQVPQAA